MERLDLATRTLFAEFQEGVFARTALAREIRSTPTYVRKRVKGTTYWYTQQYVRGQARQQYFGPSDKENDAHVAAARKELRARKAELKRLVRQEARQSAMLRRGGIAGLDRRVAALLATLSEARLVDEGGVLVGTFAYMAYGGMLGYRLPSAGLRTQDIDIVRDQRIEIAREEPIDLGKLLKGFRAVPGLARSSPPSSFISDDGLRVDLLVPLVGRPKGPIALPGLSGAGALPLPFLDFLIAGAERSVLVGPQGGIAVTVPQPARFALHKLVVAARRPAAEAAKRRKDVEQAAQLIALLAEEMPAELKKARRAVKRIGGKMEKHLLASSKALPQAIRPLIGT